MFKIVNQHTPKQERSNSQNKHLIPDIILYFWLWEKAWAQQWMLGGFQSFAFFSFLNFFFIFKKAHRKLRWESRTMEVQTKSKQKHIAKADLNTYANSLYHQLDYSRVKSATWEPPSLKLPSP